MAREPYLVVAAADVLRRLGVRTPTEDQLADATDAILDAQADVTTELGRELEPVTRTLAGQYPVFGAVDLDEASSWAPGFDDAYTVVSYTALGDGTFTVVYRVGLDGREESPIVRFVTAAATEVLRQRPEGGYGRRVVQSLSAEGQSITYAKSEASAGSGVAGSAPTLSSLRRYKRVAIYKPNLPGSAPWPYGQRG